MAEASKKAFVTGHPIAHSRSPKIHGHWLAKYGIDGSYEAIDVAPEDFAGFLATLQKNRLSRRQCHHSAQGGRLRARRRAATMRPKQIGAVNTLWFEDGALWGGNTDAHGFAANLDDHAPGWDGERPGRGARRRRRFPRGHPCADRARRWRHPHRQPHARPGAGIDASLRRRRFRPWPGRDRRTAWRCRPAGQHHGARHAWQ